MEIKGKGRMVTHWLDGAGDAKAVDTFGDVVGEEDGDAGERSLCGSAAISSIITHLTRMLKYAEGGGTGGASGEDYKSRASLIPQLSELSRQFSSLRGSHFSPMGSPGSSNGNSWSSSQVSA